MFCGWLFHFFIVIWAFSSCSGMFGSDEGDEASSRSPSLLDRVGQENKDKNCSDFAVCTEACKTIFQETSSQESCNTQSTVGQVSDMQEFFNSFSTYLFYQLKDVNVEIVKKYFSLEIIYFKKAIEDLDYDIAEGCHVLKSLIDWIIESEEVAGAINQSDDKADILKIAMERLQYACAADGNVVYSISGHSVDANNAGGGGGSAYQNCMADFNFKNNMVGESPNFRLSCGGSAKLQYCYGTGCVGGTGWQEIAPVQSMKVLVALSAYYDKLSFGYLFNSVKAKKTAAFAMGHKLIVNSCSKNSGKKDNCIKGFYCWVKRSGHETVFSEVDMAWINDKIGNLFADPEADNACQIQ